MDILTHLLSGVVAGYLYQPEKRFFRSVRIFDSENREGREGRKGTGGKESMTGGNEHVDDEQEHRQGSTDAIPVQSVSTEGSIPLPNAEKNTCRAIRLAVGIGSVLPDIDIVFLLGGWATYREYHRGPTHSLWGIFVLALLLAWVLSKRFPDVSKRRVFLWGLGGMVMHVGLDLLTSYRTYLLWPLTEYRFSTGILRFHDRTGWFLMGGAWIFAFLWDRLKRNRSAPLPVGALGILFYGGYILLQAGKRYGVLG